MSFGGYFGGNYSSIYGPFATPLDSWPSLRFTDTSPAQQWTEPLTLTQVETFLRIEYGLSVDTKQQDELSLMIMAARAAAEQFQNRDLVRKQYDMVADYWPFERKIWMRDPLISVDLIQYRTSDGTVVPMVAGTDFIVDTAKSTPCITTPFNKTWPAFAPYPSSAILIRFTAGYTPDSTWWSMTPGAMIQRGMLQLISHWFDNRIAWTRQVGNIQEFPFMVSQLLSAGAQERSNP
jgi:uncharacterized phiE125 gp8 family phage protein